jgi:uncharacterized protein (TIGR00251 family)
MQVLTITVVPSASRNDVVPTGQDNYKVYVTAPAQKGKANKDMLKILSKHLGLPVSHLIISRGDRSNKKTVLVLEEAAI